VLDKERTITVASIDKDPFHFRWPLYEGDDEAMTLEFDFDLTDYTEWKGQLRPSEASDTVVELHVDESLVAEQKIRYYLNGDANPPNEVLASMDGWVGDLQVITPAGKGVTFGTLEIEVRPQVTV
jgi:hypothetical protein